MPAWRTCRLPGRSGSRAKGHSMNWYPLPLPRRQLLERLDRPAVGGHQLDGAPQALLGLRPTSGVALDHAQVVPGEAAPRVGAHGLVELLERSLGALENAVAAPRRLGAIERVLRVEV